MSLHNEIEFENDICRDLAAHGWNFSGMNVALALARLCSTFHARANADAPIPTRIPLVHEGPTKFASCFAARVCCDRHRL